MNCRKSEVIGQPNAGNVRYELAELVKAGRSIVS